MYLPFCLCKVQGFGFQAVDDRETSKSNGLEDEVWIDVIVDLFKQLFGEDFLDYVYTTAHGTVVAEHSHPREHFFYDHDQW